MSLYLPPGAVLSSRKATIGALFHSRVPANPQHRAVVDGDRVQSYAVLEERSNRLANALLEMGRFEEAREMLGRLHGQAAMGPLDWLMTGDVLERLGPQHRDAAIAAWERSSRLRPTEAVRARLSRVGRPVLP